MKKLVLILLLALAIFSISMGSSEKKKDLSPTIQRISQLWMQQVKSLDSFLADYPKYFYDSSYAVRQRKYEELAYYFKRAANFLIYFDADHYYSNFVSPFQLQNNGGKGLFSIVPDHWLFTGPIGNEPDSVLKKFPEEFKLLSAGFITKITARYREALKNSAYTGKFVSLESPAVFDALRVEIFRISTIDMANSDFVIEDAGLHSLKGSLSSWLLFTNELVQQLPSSKKELKLYWENLDKKAREYLWRQNDFKLFDRMVFTRDHLIPLSRFLNDLQVTLQVPFIKKNSALKSDARHIYDRDIFNADYFAPHEYAKYSALKVELGELLFFDPLLSGNNKRACASCHNPAMAFTDSKVKSVGFEFNEILGRNSPTVINSGFQKKLFWDQRAASLEDQLDSVVNNPHELNGSFDDLCQKINASPEYVNLFHRAFPHTKKEGITRADVKMAIGVYERTVTGLNSRFDQYMQGDANKLTPQEINGFNVYMGKARCGVCHYAPLFNGAFPPFFDITDHHSIGVPEKDTMDKYVIDSDIGLMKSTGNPFFRFSFKTPTVRNAELTAPYMHNGVFTTLEQVVNFYDHAGGVKFHNIDRSYSKELPFFTILPIELKLTDQEKKDLVAFMKCLTDVSAAKSPKRLPEIKGKYANLNDRKIGGEY